MAPIARGERSPRAPLTVADEPRPAVLGGVVVDLAARPPQRHLVARVEDEKVRPLGIAAAPRRRVGDPRAQQEVPVSGEQRVEVGEQRRAQLDEALHARQLGAVLEARAQHGVRVGEEVDEHLARQIRDVVGEGAARRVHLARRRRREEEAQRGEDARRVRVVRHGVEHRGRALQARRVDGRVVRRRGQNIVRRRQRGRSDTAGRAVAARRPGAHPRRRVGDGLAAPPRLHAHVEH